MLNKLSSICNLTEIMPSPTLLRGSILLLRYSTADFCSIYQNSLALTWYEIL